MRPARLILTTSLMAAFATFTSAETTTQQANHPFVGMWATAENAVRHELLPNGRYIEARGNREGADRGRYVVTGTHIEYWDDTGFTADGDFVEPDTLHHGGMVLHRRARPPMPTPT